MRFFVEDTELKMAPEGSVFLLETSGEIITKAQKVPEGVRVFKPVEYEWLGSMLSPAIVSQVKALTSKLANYAIAVASLSSQPLTPLQILQSTPGLVSLAQDDIGRFRELASALATDQQTQELNARYLQDASVREAIANLESDDDRRQIEYQRAELLWQIPVGTISALEGVTGIGATLAGDGLIQQLLDETEKKLSEIAEKKK